MSMMNTNPNENKSAVPEELALWNEEEMEIPPRRVLHQPEYMRFTRYFHISLLTLFLLLMGGLFGWYHWFNR